MVLYHGSYTDIERIDLSMAKTGKDFGHGFYLIPDKTQARKMATKVAMRFRNGKPTVNSFLFDERMLSSDSGLSVKTFNDYTIEWAEFVLLNRRNKSSVQAHTYDIVVGPIANDTVGVQLSRYVSGYISMERLIEELKYHGNRAMQYFFATEKAIALLKKQSQ